MTAAGIDRMQVWARIDQRLQRRQAAAARGFEERRAPVDIAGVDVGARAQQDADDLRMPGAAGFVQRAATAGVAGVGLGAMFQQQLHAGRVVLVAAGRRVQRRHRAGQVGLGAAFQQEAREPPVAGGAGQRQRTGAVAVERVDVGASVAQQGSHAGVGAARGVMQRGVAIAVGDARVGAVGQQGHHRFRSAVPAVAGGGGQRGHAGVGGVEIDAVADETSQQAQVRQHRGQHRQAALVAGVGRRRRVRVGAGFQQRQRALHPALTGGGVERGVQSRAAQDRAVFDGRIGVFFGKRFLQQRVGAERGRRGHPQQPAMRQRPGQRAGRGEQPARAGRHQIRPCQQQRAGQRQRQQQRGAQAAPVSGIGVDQRAPVVAQRAALAFKPAPQRPGAPQPDQCAAEDRADRHRGAERAPLDQGRERPGDQHRERQHRQRPQRQDRPRIAGSVAGNEFAAAGGQRERRLG